MSCKQLRGDINYAWPSANIAVMGAAEGRVEIARRILCEAEKYGVDKKDIIFDTLAMTVSADERAGLATLEALHRIKNELGCHTSLGVSNVSFGLPAATR